MPARKRTAKFFMNFDQTLRRTAARLRATEIRKMNAKIVPHITQPPYRAAMRFVFCDFFWSVNAVVRPCRTQRVQFGEHGRDQVRYRKIQSCWGLPCRVAGKLANQRRTKKRLTKPSASDC